MYNTPWEPWEDDFLCEQYAALPVVTIAEKLERSVMAIHSRARYFGLYKMEGTKRRRESKKRAVLSPLPLEIIERLWEENGGPHSFARAIERAHGIGV